MVLPLPPSIDPELLSGVFEHSITWEDDIWSADALDVVEVHEPARRKFDQVLNAINEGRSSATSRILLFHGPSGAGKTHLMRALRTRAHTGRKGYFGYAQMTPDVGNYAEYFLRRLINSLEKPYDPSGAGESGLMRLSNLLVGRASVLVRGSLEQLREAAIEGDMLSRLIVVLADGIVASPEFHGHNLDINIVRALLYLQRNDPRIDQRVRQYLYARPINELSQPLVGALDPIEGQDRAFEIIECVGRIMRILDRAALVFSIDQVEDLRFFVNPAERFQQAVRDLIQIANRVPTSIVLIACLDDFYAETRDCLPQSFIDRVEKSGPVRLNEARSAPEARLILGRRLATALAQQSIPAGSLTVEAVLGEGYFAEVAGLSTRKLLEETHRRWQRSLGLAAEEEAAPVAAPLPADDVKAAQAIKILWDRHNQDFGAEVPADEQELLSILVKALAAAAEEMGGEVKTELQTLGELDEAAGLDLKVSHRGSRPFESRVFLCNRSNQGGGFKRQLERVLQSSEGRHGVLIRAGDYPPNAKSQAAQLVRRFQQAGGTKMVIPSYDWERMLSLEAFRARHGAEPALGAWAVAAKPLSSVPSVRELLRLDLLETQPETAGAAQAAAHGISGASAGASPNPVVKAAPRGSLFRSALAELKRLGGALTLAHHRDSLPVAIVAEPAASDTVVPDASALPFHDGDLATVDSESFLIGAAADDPRSDILLTKQILRRHAAVLGGSGSGKTTLALSVIEQLLLRGIPVVLIDRKGDLCSYANPDVWRQVPGESEERRGMREQLAASIDVAVYTPGRTSGRPINITLLPNGIAELPGHEQQLLANVSAAAIGEMLHLRHSATHQKMSGILAVALRVLGAKSRSEVRLSDLIRLLEEDDEELVELTSRMDPSGRARRDLMGQLDALLHRNAALFDGHGESLRMESLLGIGQFARAGRTRLSIIYTGFLGDNENVLFWVSQFLSEALRFCQRNPNDNLQAVIMFDEADLYIPAQSKPATKEPLESLLKRARSAGVGIMLATQSPGDVDYRSRDQITSWFIGRVREDTALKKLRAAFQSQAGLDPAHVLPNQTVGEFHLIQESRVRAIRSRRSLISADQVPFDRIELLARETRRQEAQQLRLDFGKD